ncbi:hypothetical protein PR048_027319 [Dryococelus australis]|uniref:BTB domain-containing protein n=1 Tax=Dryococelus australis TaxID=614101 RepID=A0ABQ9GGA5_9NEOP|nr:hypothetical protein PR048_027319 [Dryococelus australis]
MSMYAICRRESELNENGKKPLEESEECSRNKRLKICDETVPWDVEFAIEEPGIVHRVRAHRRVVTRSSPVFETIFRDSPASKLFQVSDVTYDAFEVMVNAMYGSDYGIGSIATACRTLLAAKKYVMPSVAVYCIDYVTRRFDATNACEIVEFSLRHDLDDLLRVSCVGIGPHACEILVHPSFLSCSLETLLVILSLDSLIVPSEAVVSDACVCWAEAHCSKYGLEPTKDHMRSALGPALGKIRFLSMTALQLIESSAFDRLLTDEEARTILINIIKPASCPLPRSICVGCIRRGH